MRINLTPKYIQNISGFDEGDVLTGEALKSIGSGKTVNIGTIAFNSTAWANLSKACIVTSFNVSYRQKVRVDTVGGELRWELTPKRITSYSVGGSSLTVKSSAQYGRKITSYTNGNDYLDKGGEFVDSSIDKSAIFGTNDLLGFDLVGGNAASFSYRLYMNNLSATLDYTPRYYAYFYDENGNLVEKQTVNGGEKATAPDISREGYTVHWSCDGMAGMFSEYNLPTSEDKDLVFRAIYNRIPKALSVDEPAKGSATVYLGWQEQQKPSVSDGKRYYTLYYGDRVKIVADGCNTVSEDLIVTQKNPFNGDIISTETIDGGDSTRHEYEFTLTYNVNVSITPRTHTYTITTQAGKGGTITATHNAVRHSNDSVIITPDFGYEIETVTIDGDTQEVGDREPLTVDFTDVTAPHSVSATFALIKIPIYFDLPEGVTVDGDSEVDFFSDGEWTFDCGENASFTSLTLDGRELLDIPVFKQIDSFTQEVQSITTPITFKAEITTDLVTVTIEQSEGGTITSDKGDGVFVAGTEISLTYVRNNNYRFSRWWDGTFGTPKTITLVEDLAVSATWTYVDYTVNAVIKPKKIGGIEFSGSVAASNMYPEEGEEVTLTATPDEKSDFDYWQWRKGVLILDSDENPLDIVWSDITGGKIEAYFAPHSFTVSSLAEGEGTVAITS